MSPRAVAPSPREVHIWCADLCVSAVRQARLRSLLSSDERARADRLRPADARRDFEVGRAALRLLLGAYAQEAPVDVQLGAERGWKPRLSGPRGDRLTFSTSRSAGLCIVAVASGRAVGVDVERIRPLLQLDALAGELLGVDEHVAFTALPPEVRTRAFYAAWTAKEARVKLLGTGLTDRLRETPLVPPAGSPWCIHRFSPRAGYAGAAAAEGTEIQLVQHSDDIVMSFS